MLGSMDDSDFVPIFAWIIGCYETLDMHEDLNAPDIHAIGLAALPAGGSECGMEVTTYHYVPDSEKLRVEQEVWNCFLESKDLRDPDPTSCAGRYTFIDGQVLWRPSEVYYSIREGEDIRSWFDDLIPWIEEKLNTTVTEASDSTPEANLNVYLGGNLPEGCGAAAGCNTFVDTTEGIYADIYVNTVDQYFAQVLKHELLHALLPMGHLPGGDYLMSAGQHNPDLTQNLSEFEEKLLAIYTYPYLRDGIRMDRFVNYLIIE